MEFTMEEVFELVAYKAFAKSPQGLLICLN